MPDASTASGMLLKYMKYYIFIRDMRYAYPFSPIVRIMKLTFILLAVLVFQVKANSFGQVVTISKSNASLVEIFREIRTQTGYDFIYTSSQIKDARLIDIHVNKVSLKEALSICFQGQPLDYSLKDRMIIVKRKPELTSPQISSSKGGYRLVTGTVRDKDKRPIPGVTVLSRELSVRTTTDKDGAYRIDVPEELPSVLVFSYIGMATKEVTYKGEKVVDVVLLEAVKAMEEMVVTGYQILKKSNVTGAVSTINAKELYLNGFTSIEQALQGKLPGVVVTNTSGLVGARQKTRVRGTSTLLGTQEPVWVVDGIIQEDPLPFKADVLNAVGNITRDNFDYVRDFVGNSIAWLNPNDIEDITVLKDAAATAIYGVRAANGVIVIRTKKGQTGPAAINYSFGINAGERLDYKTLELMNSKQRVDVSREIYNRGLTGNNVNSEIGYAGALSQYLNKTITYEEFNARVHQMETVNTDWFDILFRNPLSTNHAVSVSGGNADNRYYTSFGYNSTNGTAIGNGGKGYTGSMSMNLKLSPKLSLSARISGAQKITNGFYLVDPYEYASKTSRVIPAYNDEGGLFYYKKPESGYQYNILNERDNTGLTSKELTANTSVDVNYDIAKGLRFQTLFSYAATATTGTSYATEQTEYITRNFRFFEFGTEKPNSTAYSRSKLPVGGEYNSDNTRNETWSWRNSLSYSTLIGDKHAISAMFGQDMNSTKYTGFATTNYGYLRGRGNTFATIPLTYGGSYAFPNDLYSINQKRAITDRLTNTMGFYLTGSYTYDGKYVANFSVRTDASNRFGQFSNESFNPVWAGGLRWNMAREKWFEKSYWMSDVSFRASYGYQRNILTSVSPELILKIPTGALSQSVDQFTGEEILAISSLPYADLRWERNSSVNVGVDMSLFDGKIQASFDYYDKRGKDLISMLNVPVEYGIESMPVNGGSMRNNGWEASTSFVPVRTKDFTFSMSLSSAKNYNKVTKTGIQNVSWETAAGGTLTKAGYPVSAFWAFDFKGIDQSNGYPIIGLDVAEGADPSTDPTAYMKYMGKLDPDFTGSVGLNFRYKKLTLNTSLYLQLGGKKFLSPAYPLSVTLPTEFENLSTELLNRWTPSNTNATLPGLPDSRVPVLSLPSLDVNNPNARTVALYQAYNFSTDRVVSASTLRMNNISLNYSLPDQLAKAIGCRNINAGASASNVLAINSRDFRGRDAEVATGAQPRTRAYTLNINVSF